jgi:hypothetical protein
MSSTATSRALSERPSVILLYRKLPPGQAPIASSLVDSRAELAGNERHSPALELPIAGCKGASLTRDLRVHYF